MIYSVLSGPGADPLGCGRLVIYPGKAFERFGQWPATVRLPPDYRPKALSTYGFGVRTHASRNPYDTTIIRAATPLKRSAES